jgi:hypothetical protein
MHLKETLLAGTMGCWSRQVLGLDPGPVSSSLGDSRQVPLLFKLSAPLAEWRHRSTCLVKVKHRCVLSSDLNAQDSLVCSMSIMELCDL